MSRSLSEIVSCHWTRYAMNDSSRELIPRNILEHESLSLIRSLMQLDRHRGYCTSFQLKSVQFTSSLLTRHHPSAVPSCSKTLSRICLNPVGTGVRLSSVIDKLLVSSRSGGMITRIKTLSFGNSSSRRFASRFLEHERGSRKVESEAKDSPMRVTAYKALAK